jgi:hypothetical protein
VPQPLCYVSLLFLLLITQFLFFFPGWGVGLCRGYADLALGCLWEYCIPLSSPCGPCLPMPSHHGHLAAQGPSWFLCSRWSGDALRRLEVWRGQRFASSRWLCLQGVSPTFLQDFTLGGSFQLPPSSRYLGISLSLWFLTTLLSSCLTWDR